MTDVGISGDDNGDGLLQPGESASVTVTVGNGGQTAAPAMLGSLAIGGSDITAACGTAGALGALQPGATAILLGTDCAGGATLQINVSATAATGDVPVHVTLTQGSATATLAFSLTVSPADTPVSDIAVTAVTVSGDNSGDGFLNPGESATLTVFVKNNGDDAVTGLAGSMSTNASGVTLDCGQSVTSLWFADIGPGQTMALASSQAGCYSGGTMNITLSTAVVAGTVIPFDIALTDDAGNDYRLRPAVTVMEPGGDITVSGVSVATGFQR